MLQASTERIEAYWKFSSGEEGWLNMGLTLKVVRQANLVVGLVSLFSSGYQPGIPTKMVLIQIVITIL